MPSSPQIFPKAFCNLDGGDFESPNESLSGRLLGWNKGHQQGHNCRENGISELRI